MVKNSALANYISMHTVANDRAFQVGEICNIQSFDIVKSEADLPFKQSSTSDAPRFAKNLYCYGK